MRRLAVSALVFFLLPALGSPGQCGEQTAPALTSAARDALAASVVELAGVPGAEVFVSDVRFQDLARVSVGGELVRVSLDVAPRSGRSLPFGVFVRAGNGEIRELRATADVSVQVPVVLSSRSVPVGSVLGEEDIVVRKKDLSSSGEALIHDPSEAVGKRVRWQLTGGVPVRREYLEDPEALRRGDPVFITAESGTVSITGKGVALQSARVGDTVLVRSQSSGREISGRLGPRHVVTLD